MLKNRVKVHALPDWSERIGKVRKKLGMTRSQFVRQLQYSPMAISRCERGIQELPRNVISNSGN